MRMGMHSSFIEPQSFPRESGEKIDVYCDESCHLEHDRSKAMSLGSVWAPHSKVRAVNKRLSEIKQKHGLSIKAELKWTKIAPCNTKIYKEVIDYFFDDDDLHFRGLVVPDKSSLDHRRYGQTHDEWYYKMYFTMLKNIFVSDSQYFIYIDVKDTHSGENVRKLLEVCANSVYDFKKEIVCRIQSIRSDEVQLMQLVDILTGALAYRHNADPSKEETSEAKIDIVNRITQRAGKLLTKSTLSQERKFNLLIWTSDWNDR